MATATRLTSAHLDAALNDDRHNGWGYSIRWDLPAGKRQKLDSAVLAVANRLSLTAEDLFRWTNSKYGRWLVDDASGAAPTQQLVGRYLNPDALAVLAEEEGEE